jgi:hypothetical protein
MHQDILSTTAALQFPEVVQSAAAHVPATHARRHASNVMRSKALIVSPPSGLLTFAGSGSCDLYLLPLTAASETLRKLHHCSQSGRYQSHLDSRIAVSGAGAEKVPEV